MFTRIYRSPDSDAPGAPANGQLNNSAQTPGASAPTTPPTVSAQASGTTAPTSTGQIDLSALPTEVRELLQGLLEDKRRANDEARKAKEAAKVKSGEWEQLARERETRIAELQAIAERATALEARLASINQSRIDRIPEDKRSLVPLQFTAEQLTEWLNANEALLMQRPVAPDLNAGRQSTPSPTIDPDVANWARKLGVDLSTIKPK